MNIKNRAAAIRSAVGESVVLRSAPEVTAASWAMLCFIGGFTASAARALGTTGPFGIAAVAAAGAGLNGVFCLIGAALGYIVTGGLSWGIRYIASIVLVFTVEFAFQETAVYESRYFRPAAAALVTLATGALASFSVIMANAPAAAVVLIESLLACGSCAFFREALTEDSGATMNEELRHTSAVILSFAVFLISLSGIELFASVSLGRIIAVIAVMICSYRSGVMTGCLVGTAFGMSMDISVGGAPFFTMAYAFSGLLAGLVNRRGKVLFVIAFLASTALAVFSTWSAGTRTNALIEVFCASVIFVLLPSGVIGSLGAVVQPVFGSGGESGLRRYVAKRVAGLSSAYGSLYEIVRRNVDEPYNDSDPARIFDRAADNVCINCRDKNRCWNEEYMDTLSAMNDATAAMNERGILMTADIPEHFIKKCRMPEAFVTAVNGELRASAYRKRFSAELRENRDTAWGQYSDISDILDSFARELAGTNGADHLAERRLMRYLQMNNIDADASVYRDGSGRLHAVIESGELPRLVSEPDYLNKLSEVLGTRLCSPKSGRNSGAKLILNEAEPYSATVGIAAMKKKGEKVSGDRGTYFKTDAGVLCVILSDGMGCGEKAATGSQEVLDILEKFLRAGIDPAVAMKILNSVMLLKCGDNWGFATVDLMCVDLFTGETCFYKYGAAPSYVLNGKNIRRIKCETFATGLQRENGGAPDIVRMRLKPGSTAVIASDGVIGDSNDNWLREVMDTATDDMKLLARDTLREAEKIYGSCDDMTVLAVHIEERA